MSLARSASSTELEDCGIPCECMAINIDWLAIVMRETELGKVNRFVEQLF